MQLGRAVQNKEKVSSIKEFAPQQSAAGVGRREFELTPP
jgi:hypothetical protein